MGSRWSTLRGGRSGFLQFLTGGFAVRASILWPGSRTSPSRCGCAEVVAHRSAGARSAEKEPQSAAKTP